MLDNPYESPKSITENSAPRLDENTKKFFGTAREDLWRYGYVFSLCMAIMVQSIPFVFIWFAISTVFLLIYLIKNNHGFLSNLLAIVVQIGAVTWKGWLLSF